MNLKFVILLTIASLLIQVEGANILFYFAVSGYSHRIGAWPIIEKLADLGHNVTFLSPYQPKSSNPPHPNITDYVPSSKKQGVIDIDFISLRLREGVAGIDRLWDSYWLMGLKRSEELLNNPEFLEWINNSHFDLIVVNAIFNELGYGLAHKYGAKVIVYSPTSHMGWWKEAFGLPDENIPEMQFHFPKNMTFFQSLKNSLLPLISHHKRRTVIFPKIQQLIENRLNLTDMPPLEEIEKKTSIVFTNTHPAEEFARALPRNFVEIGGIHCNDNRKLLPKVLEDFIMTSGNDGFVLLSFGTFAEVSNLPKTIQDIFFRAISKVPNVKFIIKFTGETPENFPKNAIPAEWIPQQDLIAHPKIRAFIGHGGLLGTQEAVYHGVPMVVVPLFAEQDYQAQRALQRETAVVLELSDITEEKLLNAILEVLNNKKYKENSVKLSKLFRDRPWNPTQEAVWWIEYVLRNDDVSHLRSFGINQSWYQRRMLHIWGFLEAFILSVVAIILMLGYFFFKGLLKLFKPVLVEKPKQQ